MKLQLGFEDIPYAQRYSAESPILASIKKRVARKQTQAQQSYGQGKTSGEVAAEIEKKYSLVEVFYGLEEDFVIQNFEESYANSLDLGMWGQSWDVAWDPSPLEGKFRRSLSQRRFDGIIKGVPTKASLAGVSHLRRDPFKKGASQRPSFINTGLYQRSFRAWTEE
jgi:hypothetical protein